MHVQGPDLRVHRAWAIHIYGKPRVAAHPIDNAYEHASREVIAVANISTMAEIEAALGRCSILRIGGIIVRARDMISSHSYRIPELLSLFEVSQTSVNTLLATLLSTQISDPNTNTKAEITSKCNVVEESAGVTQSVNNLIRTSPCL
jgi:hypothetical protein